MPRKRNVLISIFVVAWLIIFHYESLRYAYLNPLFGKQLPKIKFLFPPAGWIMFFSVDERYGMAEVYGLYEGTYQLIDPHKILRTRAIGYDNIKRNALVGVLEQGSAPGFCAYLKQRFPDYEHFAVTYVYYPALIKRPFLRQQTVAYECPKG